MKKHQQNNTKKLEQKLKSNKSKEFKQMLDVIFFIGLLAIGFVGLALVYEGNRGIQGNTGSILPTMRNIQYELPEVHFDLEIIGDKEILERLEFNLAPFEKDVEYIIDFGDGTRKKRIKSSSIAHRYEEARMYLVRVYRRQNGEVKTIYKSKLDIGLAPEYKSNNKNTTL